MAVHSATKAEAFAGIFDRRPVGGMSDTEIANSLVGYAGQITALTARFIELLAEFDERSAWGGEGIASCAQWLSWRVGMSMRTAQDHVRVARALRDLPMIAAEFGAGRLSFSKVRALTRVATSDREQELVNVALSSTAKQVETLVGALRRNDRADAESESGEITSTGHWRWHDDGSLVVSLRLAPLDGARFLAGAVRAEYERTRTDDSTPGCDIPTPVQPDDQADATDAPRQHHQRDLWRHVPADLAPAVIAMADALRDGIAMPEIAPGAEVVVYTLDATQSVSEASVPQNARDANDPGPVPLFDPHIDGGPALSDTEVAEAECGASVRDALRGRDGVTLRWGRKRRAPTAALIRIVSSRDRGCMHPGCGRTRHLHIHHVTPWSAGGTTDPDNLILLCSSHHRALHQGTFGIVAHGRQRFTFHRADGSLIPRAPTTPIPDGWQPDPAIAADAPVPIGGGRLDLGYATEVLHAAWAWKKQQEDNHNDEQSRAA